jgi:hypothetical protein
MPDIHIDTINITLGTQAPHRPGILMRDSEFIRGYEAGVHGALYEPAAGVPLSDKEILEILKELHDDGVFEKSDFSYFIGNLLGVITARW